MNTFTDLQNAHLACFYSFRGSLTELLSWTAEENHQTWGHPEILASATVRGLLGPHVEDKGHSHILSTYHALGLMQGTDCWRLQEDEAGGPATSHETRHSFLPMERAQKGPQVRVLWGRLRAGIIYGPDRCPHQTHAPLTELLEAGERSDSSQVTRFVQFFFLICI